MGADWKAFHHRLNDDEALLPDLAAPAVAAVAPDLAAEVPPARAGGGAGILWEGLAGPGPPAKPLLLAKWRM